MILSKDYAVTMVFRVKPDVTPEQLKACAEAANKGTALSVDVQEVGRNYADTEYGRGLVAEYQGVPDATHADPS